MIRKIKNRKPLAFRTLKVLWKVFVLALQVVASFASEERPKDRYTAAKAQQLYEDGAISGTEFARHIHGDD
ncbi:MAG: hypothetical protein H0U75_06155 [Legionella sp.]|nr:hypothetical protein [Legionella sp.]